MTFTPCNRYILIERESKTPGSTPLIELPEGSFTSDLQHHEKVFIKAVASSVRPPISPQQHAIVLSHMIEEVEFGDQTVYLVLENHILGIVSEKENYDK